MSHLAAPVRGRPALEVIASSVAKNILLFLALVCAAHTKASYPEGVDIRVITHPNVSITALSNSSLRSIFGMRNRTWPQGGTIKVFVLNGKSTTHVDFTKKILQTFPYNLQRIWDRSVYSGTGQSPITVRSEEEMHELIASTPNSIGYVSSRWLSNEVKVMELK